MSPETAFDRWETGLDLPPAPCPECHGFGFVSTPHREKVDGYLEDVLRSCLSCAGNGTV